ncbi:hypothetical protein Rumeso_01367 [Rubellimicrobium mesophilum DSM 19309]|uniref:Uncharacterized protein n=1 Tax=Rubellimicrobium mesophilum DSM 19309 TaxID=442562 RepID=A0A017HSJ9_9RHOB|nr:hypothetical protein [Rubellimicrobium mesophilum]EYD77108.1 hypothetical protein Rumeso_01367 [Rubellimicrobium mesophilum DSM 19309]
MQYEDYAAAIHAGSALPLPARLKAYRERVDQAGLAPLSAFEEALADSHLIEGARTGYPWLHGAPAGHEVGDVLRPDPGQGSAGLTITDVPFWAEHMADQSRQLGLARCVYVVEPQGSVSMDPAAFRLALLCILDKTMDRDSPEIIQGMMLAAATRQCESATVLRVLVVPEEGGARH